VQGFGEKSGGARYEVAQRVARLFAAGSNVRGSGAFLIGNGKLEISRQKGLSLSLQNRFENVVLFVVTLHNRPSGTNS
jgi:hypothetical protein